MIRRLLNRFYAADGGGGAGSGDAGGAGGAGGGTGGAGGDGGDNSGEKKYSDEALEKIVSERAERASKAAMKSYFEQQGMTAAEAEAAIKDYRESRDKKRDEDKSTVAGMQKRIEEFEASQKADRERTMRRLVMAEAKSVATSAGIKAERIDYALRLADLSAVKVSDDGVPDSTSIRTAVEKVLADIPELRTVAVGGGAGGFRIGGGDGGGASGADEASLRRAFGLPEKK